MSESGDSNHADRSRGSTPPRHSNLSKEHAPPVPRSSPSPASSHRTSFSEHLRHPPSSPRSSRHLSINSQAFQELLNNPPLPHKSENPFQGRDWKKIRVAEVIDAKQVYWCEQDTSVEDATNLLITAGSPNVVLVRENPQNAVAIDTFDYSDVNAYLLLMVGQANPDDNQRASYNELFEKGRSGAPVPIRDIGTLGHRDPLVTLPHTAELSEAVEIFGSGIHRIIIHEDGTQDTVGVLTQLRLVNFFWEYGRVFPSVEPLFANSLRDLDVGSHAVRFINGDRPLVDALKLMNQESITSLPVLDNSRNVVGNISHVDTRLLTKSSSLPLLNSSCIHFISVILSERGMNEGQDSFPVFYVNPYSTLAHTVAKLVATRSHRMWMVDSPSPGSSAPPTPVAVSNPPPTSSYNQPLHNPPYTGTAGSAVSAASLPGQQMSGRLSGVVSLTDVLNMFGRASGLNAHSPEEARRRRRSSSSSVRPSIDSMRTSSFDLNTGPKR